ncbi:unnamed protein product [Nezara viridula]|uniref:Methionine--tRNA ligase, cytoplasmic n=1 Tax=Nezara viridula TaxID=85310 RepID=A0A9P0HTU9_NEZVI|nr:unnamed protein product [Nezara viridula]
MKLYTNDSNTISLKILISCEIVGKNVEIEIVQVDDKRFQGPKRLPVLLLDTGVSLFSSNTAASVLFHPQEEDVEAVNKWLSWEAEKLQPVLVLYHNKNEFISIVEELFNELNSALSSTTHLVGDKITTADICVWSALYPIYTEEKFKSKLFNDRKGILKWFENLYQQKYFKDAEKKLNAKKGFAAMQSIATACWYPLPSSVSEDVSVSSKEKSDELVSAEEVNLAISAWEKGPSSRVKIKQTKKPILPLKGEKNILITSALPYVNNVPHLGNIIGCVLSADVFARYCRARSWNTLFISGTDEYGTATETKALEEGLTPQEICDKYFAIHSDIYSWFNISFDHFGRTTTVEQKEVVQNIFNACHKNGFTSVAEMDQLFCEKCERFLADRFVEGTCPDCKFEDARGDQCDGCGHLMNTVDLIAPRCKLCQTTPVVRQSQQLFLELPKIDSWLGNWVDQTSNGWSNNAKVITKSWLNKGLKPRCITRDLKWGVPVPLKNFEQKVFYVWFDAPIGYMSMTKVYTKDWLKWWKVDPQCDVKLYQFMAKDNVPFHGIMFPATLYASKGNYVMLSHLMATEYLNYEDGKFSKSRGIGVFGNDAKETGIPSDIFRFYLLYIRPESQDSNFSWADFAIKVNTELLNNVGNFINRSLMFADKFYAGCIPPISVTEEEKKLLGLVRMELKSYISSLDKAKLREGIKYILNISRHGNLYIQSHKPWELVKGSDDEKSRAGTIVGVACNMVCLLTSLLQPYMPDTVKTLSQQLNLPIESFSIEADFIPYLDAGHKIGKPFPLFTKIEPAVAESLKAKYAGRQKSGSPESVAPSTPSNVHTLANANDYLKAIKSLEEAVTKQGDLVRSMKAAGKSKEELQPMISALLDIKKKHTEMKTAYEKQANGLPLPEKEKTPNPDLIASLEKEVANQGEKVRILKTSGADKTVWQPEVNILLDLKKKLAEATGTPVVQPQPAGKKKKSKK